MWCTREKERSGAFRDCTRLPQRAQRPQKRYVCFSAASLLPNATLLHSWFNQFTNCSEHQCSLWMELPGSLLFADGEYLDRGSVLWNFETKLHFCIWPASRTILHQTMLGSPTRFPIRISCIDPSHQEGVLKRIQPLPEPTIRRKYRNWYRYCKLLLQDIHHRCTGKRERVASARIPPGRDLCQYLPQHRCTVHRTVENLHHC